MSEQKKIDFTVLNIKIPEIVYSYPPEEQQKVFEYLHQMDEIQRQAYYIAYDHLGTSFSINRSNGFKKWLTKSQISPF
jgi:hypothetical protein